MANILKEGFGTPEGTTRIHTVNFITASPKGSGWTGFCDLVLFTPEGQPNYATMLSPNGVQEMASNLLSILAAMPEPPKISYMNIGGKILGEIQPGSGTKTYFGQTYQSDVLEALGVLTHRANIIDQTIIDLSVAITGTSSEQAHAQYYATTNLKARLDSVRALLHVSNLPPHIIKSTIEALDKSKSVADRRNDLVHARWSFRNGKHRATIFRPNAKVKIAEITVTAKSVLDIVEAYSLATTLLVGATAAVQNHRHGL